MRISLGIKTVLPLLALFTLAPSPAFATGSEGPSAAEFILTSLATMAPALTLAFYLAKGEIKKRVFATVSTLIVGTLFCPLSFILTNFGGWIGIAVSVAVPLAFAWFINRPKKARTDTPEKE